jgi:WD repeat-containing protein 59
MPSFDQHNEQPKKGKVIKSAFDSESFDADLSIHVKGLVGSATISPSGRDVALASYVCLISDLAVVPMLT